MADVQEMNPFLQNAIEENKSAFLNYSPLPSHLSEPTNELDLLKVTVDNLNISSERLPKFDSSRGKQLTTETEQIAALLRKNGVYVGKDNDVYRVMSSEQSYMIATLARRETPRPDILEKLQTAGLPSIYEERAFIETNMDAKLYRTRTRGKQDKVLASYKASEMLGTRQATVRAADIIEGNRIVMEEYMLGAHESTANDSSLINSDNSTTFLAHALITEDLDWQSRNFVVNSEGELVRVDSKQVFVQEGDDPNITASSEADKQEMLKTKIGTDFVMKAIIEKADHQKVLDLLQTFNIEKYSAVLQEAGIEISTRDSIIAMTRENIQKAEQRLQEYKLL